MPKERGRGIKLRNIMNNFMKIIILRRNRKVGLKISVGNVERSK
jgi:hypothetical protein